jgi:hypothetical protein
VFQLKKCFVTSSSGAGLIRGRLIRGDLLEYLGCIFLYPMIYLCKIYIICLIKQFGISNIHHTMFIINSYNTNYEYFCWITVVYKECGQF